MAENSGHNKYTFGIAIVVISAALLVIFYYDLPNRLSSIGVGDTEIKLEPKKEPPTVGKTARFSDEEMVFFEGKWRVTYNVRRCNVPEDNERFADRLSIEYEVNLRREKASLITGKGDLTVEFYDGRSRDWGEGTIVFSLEKEGAKIIGKSVRINTTTNGRGNDSIELSEIKDFEALEVIGTYTNSSNRCYGEVVMEKIE
jgi:hypothetical protein